MTASTMTRRPTSSTTVRTSRDPFSLLRHEIDDLISRVWQGNEEGGFSGTYAPAMDIVEAENDFEARLDVPGMEAKDFDVQVHGNTVTVTGQRKEEKEEKGKTFHRIERRSGSFSRTVTLPCSVNEDEVAADYANGVLTIKLPKCDEAKPRKINVKG